MVWVIRRCLHWDLDGWNMGYKTPLNGPYIWTHDWTQAWSVVSQFGWSSSLIIKLTIHFIIVGTLSLLTPSWCVLWSEKPLHLLGFQPLQPRQTLLSWQSSQSNNTNVNIYVIIICIWTLEQAEHIAWTILPLQSFHLYKIYHKACQFSFKSFRIELHYFEAILRRFCFAFCGSKSTYFISLSRHFTFTKVKVGRIGLATS